MTCVFTFEGKEYVGEDAFKAHLRSLRPEQVERFMSNPNVNRRLPDMPFKDNRWAALALKRMVRYAAENGFDQVSWIRGQHAVERFSLEKVARRIMAERRGDLLLVRTDNVEVEAALQRNGMGKPYEKGGGGTLMTEAQVKEAFGSDLGGRMWNGAEKDSRTFEGADLRVGGEGMRAFYDRILPNIANDLGKKYGARVGETEIETPRVGEDTALEVRDRDGNVVAKYQDENVAMAHAERIGGSYGFPETPQTTVHSLPITPEMRDAAVFEGQPLFSMGGRRPAEDAEARDAYAKLSPVDQALADDPGMKIAMEEGLVPAERAIEMSVEAQRQAQEMKRGYDAAISCAIRHGGSMAGRSFVTLGASQAAGAAAGIGQGLGLAASIPTMMAATPMIAANARANSPADSPLWRQRMEVERMRANAARDAGRRAADVGPDGYLNSPVADAPYQPDPRDVDADWSAEGRNMAEPGLPNPGVPSGVNPEGFKVPPVPASFKEGATPDDEAQALIEAFRPLIEGSEE